MMEVPDIVVGRLPIYLRALTQMAEAGEEITSSHELGERLGISSAQIRKDLSHFGTFGKQGTGYRIAELKERLRQILHVDRFWEVALVGAGDLGHALARYGGFRTCGFEITMIFDNDPAKIGMRIGEVTVEDVAGMQERIRAAGIRLAMVAVPGDFAQGVVDQLVAAGIRGILSFAPARIVCPRGIAVRSVDFAVDIEQLAFLVASRGPGRRT